MGKKLPGGWATNAQGDDATEPAEVMKCGALLPLGGTREQSGHKGYCLASMVDILCSVLSGGNWGPNVRKWLPGQQAAQPGEAAGANATTNKGKVNGIGHFFGALRIDGFRPVSEFQHEMDKWIRTFKACPPVDPVRPVLVPGEPEREATLRRQKEGIPLKLSVAAGLLGLDRKWRTELRTMGVAFILDDSDVAVLEARLRRA